MRFFSNDAPESTDETATDRPDKVQSDPVAVPNQRPPSPWSNTPSATADTDREPADEQHHDDAGDPPATSSTSTYASGTATEHEEKLDAHDHGGPADEVDLPLDDKAGAAEESSDPVPDPADAEPTDSAPVNDHDLDRPRDLGDTVAEPPEPAEPEAASEGLGSETLKDDGDSEDVDPAADAPLVAPPAAESTPDDSTEPAVVPVPVGAAVTAPDTATDKLFGADDAQSLHERWRDVQLRFVDSPKDAAADAAKLVDEAVDKLTAGLKAQRDGLADDTEDTERLRVQLRGYRDILNRILGL